MQSVLDSQHRILSTRTLIKPCLFWKAADALVNELRPGSFVQDSCWVGVPVTFTGQERMENSL